MPATLIEKVMPNSPFSGEGVDLVWTPLDNANGNYFPSHRDCFLLVWNTDVSPQTFEMTSAEYQTTGRTADISEIITAGTIRMYRLAIMGWADADGMVNIPSGQNALLLVALFPTDTEPA